MDDAGTDARFSAPWITTASGRKVRILDPDPESIFIGDVAAHLSGIRRYSGIGISVALHSMLVSEHLPLSLALEGLIHDAAEAYTGDLTRPMQEALRESAEFWARTEGAWHPSDAWDKLFRCARERLTGKAWIEDTAPSVCIEDNRAAGIEAEALFAAIPGIERWWDALPERLPCWLQAVRRGDFSVQTLTKRFFMAYESLRAGREPGFRFCSCIRPRGENQTGGSPATLSAVPKEHA